MHALQQRFYCTMCYYRLDLSRVNITAHCEVVPTLHFENICITLMSIHLTLVLFHTPATALSDRYMMSSVKRNIT